MLTIEPIFCISESLVLTLTSTLYWICTYYMTLLVHLRQKNRIMKKCLKCCYGKMLNFPTSVHLCCAIHWLTWRAERSCHLSTWGCAPSPVSAVPEPEEKPRGRATSLSCSLRWQGRHLTPGSTELLHASSTRMNELNCLLTTAMLTPSGLWRPWGFTSSAYFYVHSSAQLILWYSMFLKRGSDRSTVSFYAFTALSFPFCCYRWQPLVVFIALEQPHFMWPDDINYDTTVMNEN